jgi:hypothetical protein
MTVIDRPFADFTSLLVVLPADMAVAPVFDGIAREAAIVDSLLEQVLQRDARLNDVARHLIHIHVALIADDETFVAVEHAQALQHIVDRNPHAQVIRTQHSGEHGQSQRHGKEGNDCGEK